MTSLADIKISVVMAAYNASHSVGNTLDNILGQTHKNLEIIIVDDGSTDAIKSVVGSYQKKHDNIQLISLEKNVGPYKARIIGVDNASGEFLHFIDADDYISIDFYRTMLQKAVENTSDIVIGSIVLDFKNDGYIRDFPLINDLPFNSLEGTSVFKSFMDQGGLNFIYQMNSTKLYRMSLWEKARPHYDSITDHLIMADDVALNIPLWYFAARIDRTPTATLFYVKDDNDSATSNYKISQTKMLKNINDLRLVFSFFNDFLSKHKIKNDYKEQLLNWEKAFVRVYYTNITNSHLKADEKEALLKELFSIATYSEKEHWLDTPFFHINELWRSSLEDSKSKIANPETQTVIFHFDSLILTVNKPDGTAKYTIRQSGFELYQLARYLGKTIRIQSTLPLFEELLKIAPFSKDSIEPLNSHDIGIGSVDVDLPNPLTIFLDRGLEQPFHFKYTVGNSTHENAIIEMVANHYFDNPYRIFIDNTAFSGKLSFLGYYSLGLSSVLSLSQPEYVHPQRQLLDLIDSTEHYSNPYEAYLKETIHLGIADFKRDLDLHFGKRKTFLSSLGSNAVAAFNLSFYTQVWADRQLLAPLAYKYRSIFNNYEHSNGSGLSSKEYLHGALAGKGKFTKLAVYSLVDRGLIISAVKKRVHKATLKTPVIHKTLKHTYTALRKAKNRLK